MITPGNDALQTTLPSVRPRTPERRATSTPPRMATSVQVVLATALVYASGHT